jgi:hypothetical protein
MAAASEYDIALSMMRLWGSEAKNLASKYALEHECLNNAMEADRWHAVQDIVAHCRRCEARLRTASPAPNHFTAHFGNACLESPNQGQAKPSGEGRR